MSDTAGKIAIPLKSGSHLVVENNDEAEALFTEIAKQIDEVRQNHFEPFAVVLGKFQYKQLIAYSSGILKTPTFPNQVAGVQVITLNQEHYMDVIAKPGDMIHFESDWNT